MKLGLDIHGVINKDPQVFIKLAKNTASEVHIITGITITDKLVKQLKEYNKGKQWWTHLVSVEDELMKSIPCTGFNEFDRPYWEDEVWNSFKGIYCANNNIDIHFDDSHEYREYFNKDITKFILYK